MHRPQMEGRIPLLLLVSCLTVTATSAIFWPLFNLPGQRQSLMNVCIYSVNPARYQPKCFMCPSGDYPNVLRACVNAAAIPSNISYTQAACLEQNCAIRRGKRSVEVLTLHPNSDSNDNNALPDDGAVAGTEDGLRDHPPAAHQDTEEFFASDGLDDYNEETLDE